MEMEVGNIVDFLENKSILVTGGTGFLAKIFVEKILRVQPKVKKLFLLIKAVDDKAAQQRFNSEAVGKKLFDVLKEKYGRNLGTFLSEKITAVAGDITCENLGIKDFNLIQEMYRDVDVVVNVAATTKFDERYDVALAVNTFGAMYVLNFAKKCVKIKLLLHVSTAYVCGEKQGLILESPYYLGETLNNTNGLDIDTEKKIIDQKLNELNSDHTSTDQSIALAMRDLGLQRAYQYGWPNTYIFTKALGEMILGRLKENITLVILRPTIISSTYKEPFPGWVEGMRTMDSIIIGYGKGRVTCLPGDPESIVDVVPADIVVNVMIATIVAHANQLSEIIYQVGSSVSNPLELSKIPECMYHYFTKNPIIRKNGKSIIVEELKLMNSMASFHRYFFLRYLLPLLGLRVINGVLCQAFKGTYTDLKRKMSYMLRLVDLYKPYLFSKSVYDGVNTEKLHKAIVGSGDQGNIFYFDLKIIDWDDYLYSTHIPGVMKHVIKDART